MIEMDKSRDVRRRFAKQSGHKQQQLLSVPLEKTKKERIKRLSAVNSNNNSRTAASTSSSCCPGESCEMGGGGADVSDRDDEDLLPSSGKRFKLPRKFFHDCNGVDHASVPRKLRSAMKKRNCESISPPFLDSKKLNFSTGGVESCKSDGVKKLKLNVKQGGSDWCPKQNFCGPITKDEEEVAQTLYNLAEMFPNYLTENENKSVCASLDASPLPQANKSLEDSAAVEEDLNSTCPSSTHDAAPASNMDRVPEQTVDVYSNKSSVQEPSDFSGSIKVHEDYNCSIPKLNLQTVLAKQEEQKPLTNPVSFCISNEPYQDPGKLKQPVKIETSLLYRTQDIGLGLASGTGSSLDQQPNESRKNGPAFWPGMPSTAPSDAWNHGSLSRACASRIPRWLDSALCGMKPASSKSGPLPGKASKANADRRSWKRCATHLYISRLIQVLKIPESEDRQLLPNQLRPQEILKQGVLMTMNDFNGIRNGLSGVTSSSNNLFNTTERSSSTAGIGILQYQKCDQDQPPQPSVGSGGFNFLSLSAASRGLEVNSSFSGGVKELEPSAKLKVPYLQSHVQHPTILPFPISQSSYPSSSYPDQPSATVAQQLQMSPYLGSPFYGHMTTSTQSTKQIQKQNQHHQQLAQHQLWAAQLAAQYRAAGTSAAMSQFPNWQNGRRESPATVVPCAPASIPSSAPSLDVLCPTYPQISQQQQLMPVASSLPIARVKRQDHHLSSFYEDTGGGFLAGSALPLQLLCNERI